MALSLAEYLKLSGISVETFAEAVGAHPVSVRRYIAGSRFPRPAMLQKMIKVSGGRLSADSFLRVLKAA
jgi:transcriptional regulator with XRE-family HTH domain